MAFPKARWEPWWRRAMRSTQWVPLLSLVVAVSAVAVSAFTAYQTRHFYHLTARPHLRFRSVWNDEGVGWHLDNVGSGIAVVRWFEVRVDGRNATGVRWCPLWVLRHHSTRTEGLPIPVAVS